MKKKKEMEINQHFQIIIENIPHFVYKGTCDGIPTKWVTKTEWDGNITLKLVNNKLKYFDIDEDEILVFNEDDVEYKYIEP
jgi:hypothetical protein